MTALAVAMTLAGCATSHPAFTTIRVEPGAHYVAMGSSFASGPGIATPDPRAPRCGRSLQNYAHILARSLSLELDDVSCGGATTANILGPWNELPPQIDAVNVNTRLVTLTVGGNDVGYIGGLIAASCRQMGGPPPGSPFKECPKITIPEDSAWQELENSLVRIVDEVRARAPSARIVLVDYLAVLPADTLCDVTPLSKEQASAARRTASRLAALTARVARAKGVAIIRASDLSRGHDACSRQPWVTGFPIAPGPPAGVPYHPNRAGMNRLAEALQSLLTDAN